MFDCHWRERINIERNKACLYYQARQEGQGAGRETVRWEMAAVGQISDHSDIRVDIFPWIDCDISLAYTMNCTLKNERIEKYLYKQQMKL